MDSPWILIVFGVTTVYFGKKALPILPCLVQLLAALLTGAVKWPGPRIHDPDPSASTVRARLGVGYQNLFPTFLFNALVGVSAFALSLILQHSARQ
jgi:hypothetical protein